METLHYTRMRSPVGPLVVGASERGLVLLHFDRGDFPPNGTRAPGLPPWARAVRWEESSEGTARYVRELEEYFAGTRREFSFLLDIRGTEFQKSCWRALLDIPYGATATYADVARAIGRPTAFRAVGMANHDNPIAIVVPCHRVLAADGSLHGYGGGLDVKEKLLRLEGVRRADIRR